MPDLPAGSASPAASSSRSHRCTGLPGDGHLLRLQQFHDRGRHHPARAALHELAHPPPGRGRHIISGHAAGQLVDVPQVGGHGRASRGRQQAGPGRWRCGLLGPMFRPRSMPVAMMKSAGMIAAM
jgi:hypothetical protein